MDLELLCERIRQLEEARDACDCQSIQGRRLRTIANMLIENYDNLRRRLLSAIADEFFADDCDNAN